MASKLDDFEFCFKRSKPNITPSLEITYNPISGIFTAAWKEIKTGETYAQNSNNILENAVSALLVNRRVDETMLDDD